MPKLQNMTRITSGCDRAYRPEGDLFVPLKKRFMNDLDKKRHIHKSPEECPEPDCRPETNVERTPDKQWPHELPCAQPKEQPTKTGTPPEYRPPEED